MIRDQSQERAREAFNAYVAAREAAGLPTAPPDEEETS